MTSYARYDAIKKEFPSILKEHLGIVGHACKEANISRETYYRWRRESAEFAKLCDEAEIITGGMVKDRLIKRILEDDTTAIIFYCKTKLKHEGFVERWETTGKDGGAVEHKHDFANLNKEQIDVLIRIGHGE